MDALADTPKIIQALGRDCLSIFLLDFDNDAFIDLKNETGSSAKVSISKGLEKFYATYAPDDKKELTSLLAKNRFLTMKSNHSLKSIHEKIIDGKPTFVEIYVFPLSRNKDSEEGPHFLLYERLLPLEEGKDNSLLLEVENTLRSERLINSAFASFGPNNPFNESVNNLLKEVTNFYNASSTFLCRLDGKLIVTRAAWPAKAPEASINWPLATLDFASEAFKRGDALLVETVDGLKEEFPLDYEILSKHKIVSLSLAPLFIDRQLYGFIAVNNPKFQRINNITNILLSIASHLAALIKNEETETLLYTDKITGLPTIAKSNLQFKNLLFEVPPKQTYILIKFDLTQFKLINSYYGEKYANTFLFHIADFLSRDCDEVKLVTRLPNSDTFYFLADGNPALLKEGIDKRVAEFSARNARTRFNFSFGCYVINDPHEPLESIMNKVSLAHEKARNTPNSHFCLYNQEIEKQANHEQEILDNFSGAIENKEFEVFIQPKYDIATASFFGGEALVRWKHNGSYIMPNDFIPILEKNGLITTLDHYMLVDTLKNIRSWTDQGLAIVPISINFSRIDFYNTTLINNIISIIDSFNIQHEYIEIEITESAYIEQESRIKAFVEQCQKAHIKVNMDDFGSGYSSLNSLKDMPFDVLKLDYVFLKKSEDEARRDAVIASITKLCEFLHAPLIVEGVEDQKDVDFLERLGVRYIQGFFFGRPMPILDFLKLKKKNVGKVVVKSVPQSVIETLFDPNSPFNYLFDHALSSIGLAILKPDGSMHLVMQNKKLASNDIARRTDLFAPTTNIFDLCRPNEKKSFIKYITDVIANNSHPEHIYLTVDDVEAPRSILLRATFVETTQDGSLVLLEGISSIKGPLFSNKNASQLEKLTLFFDNVTAPLFAISSSNTIFYMNKAAFLAFPDIQAGDGCDKLNCTQRSCDVCPLHNFGRPQTFYQKNTNRFIDVFSTPLIINGEKAILAEVNPYESSTGNTGLKRVDTRMSIAMQGIISAYLEINLKTGHYHKYEFDDRSLSLPNDGDFTLVEEMLLKEQIDPAFTKRVSDKLTLKGLRKGAISGERYKVRIKFKDSEHWIEDTVTFIKDEKVPYACICVRDVTNEVLKDFDQLSKLLNRNSGKSKINAYLAANTTKMAALSLIDINKFKSINDTYGHPTGDKVITAISDYLRHLPNNRYGFATRLGGDEFVLVIKNLAPHQSIIAYERKLKNGVIKIGQTLGLKTPLTISIGSSIYPTDSLTFDGLYSVADERMYLMKKK